MDFGLWLRLVRCGCARTLNRRTSNLQPPTSLSRETTIYHKINNIILLCPIQYSYLKYLHAILKPTTNRFHKKDSLSQLRGSGSPNVLFLAQQNWRTDNACYSSELVQVSILGHLYYPAAIAQGLLLVQTIDALARPRLVTLNDPNQQTGN